MHILHFFILHILISHLSADLLVWHLLIILKLRNLLCLILLIFFVLRDLMFIDKVNIVPSFLVAISVDNLLLLFFTVFFSKFITCCLLNHQMLDCLVHSLAAYILLMV